MENINLKIDGMGCSACAKKVRKALEGMTGIVVSDVKVGSAALMRDPARAPDAALIETLSLAGYRATVEVEYGNDNGSCCCSHAC